MRKGHQSIDIGRAEELRKDHLTWREIGIILAKEDGRKLPYHAESVKGAVAQAKERKVT